MSQPRSTNISGTTFRFLVARCPICRAVYRWRAEPRGPHRLPLARCRSCRHPLRAVRRNDGTLRFLPGPPAFAEEGAS